MNPSEKTELMKLIQFIQDKYQIAVLLVEHDMQVVMGICERVIVLEVELLPVPAITLARPRQTATVVLMTNLFSSSDIVTLSPVVPHGTRSFTPPLI